MAKFQINSKGIPAPCHAKKGNCPFGGEDSHYDNMEKAKEEAARLTEEAEEELRSIGKECGFMEELLRRLVYREK